MHAKISALFATTFLCWGTLGQVGVQAAEMFSSFDVKGSGTGVYTLKTDDPNSAGFTGSGNAAFQGTGSFGLFISTVLTFTIDGVAGPVEVVGDQFDGNGDYSLIGNTLTANAFYNNYNDNVQFDEINATLSNLVFSTSVVNGFKTYNIVSGTGTVTYTSVRTNDIFNDDGTITTFESDSSAVLNLTSVSGTYTTPYTVPLPASAPLFGVALLALGAFGYGLNRRSRSQAT